MKAGYTREIMPAFFACSFSKRYGVYWLFVIFVLASMVKAESRYTVVRGDTLYEIAREAGTDVDTLQALNNLSGTTIRVGQILTLPTGNTEILAGYPNSFRVYHLQAGDTLEQVARKHGVSSQSLREVNPEHTFGALPVGTAMRIPPSSGFMTTIEGQQNVLSLAVEYGIAPVEIARANDLASLSDIQAGQSIFVPLQGAPPRPAQLENPRQPEETVNTAPLESNPFLAPTVLRSPAQQAPASEAEQARARRQQLLNQQKRLLGQASSLLVNYEPPSLIFTYPLARRSRVTSLYGWRYLEITGQRFHHGIDLAAATGTAILASKAGQVSRAGWVGTYGYAVYINHNDGTQTRYAHMDSVAVRAGQYVNQSEVIGRVGSTGLSTGPHLHFELRVNGYSVDPREYLDF